MLDRFVSAQAPLFDALCAELAAGRKRSHWMWFVFPQLRALGRSATARCSRPMPASAPSSAVRAKPPLTS